MGKTIKRDEEPKSKDVEFISKEVHSQVGGTCYAHAVATAIRATEKRIGKKDIEKHSNILKRLTKNYGSKGAKSLGVLRKECASKFYECKSI